MSYGKLSRRCDVLAATWLVGGVQKSKVSALSRRLHRRPLSSPFLACFSRSCFFFLAETGTIGPVLDTFGLLGY